MLLADAITAISGVAADFPELVVLATAGGVISLAALLLARIVRSGR